MSRMNRRRFTWVATSGVASVALVACGGDAVDDDLTPTRIADVEGAPPTLAPNATPFSSDDGGEEGDAGAEGGEENGAAAGSGEAITIEAQDPFNWSTYELEAAPGQEIHVVNTGAMQHDFVIDEWELATDLLNGGDEATVTVPEDAEVGSEVVFYCSVPGHRESGMEGTLTVVEGGGDAAAEEEPAEDEEAADEEGAAAGAGETITIEAQDPFNWSTYELEAAPGQEIHVVNTGAMQHDFVIDEWELATDLLNGGDEATVTVPEDAEVGSEVVFYCSVPGHRESGMEGTLTVVEGGGDAAAEEEPAEDEAPADDEEEQAVAAGPVDPSETITVEALDTLAYEPSEIAVAPGQTILVVNVGSMQHDFVVDEWGLATSLLDGGAEEEFIVPDNAEVGESYTFYCSVPGHQVAGMQGTLTVAEAAGDGEGEEEAEPTEEPTPEEEEAAPEDEGTDLQIEENAIRVASLDSMRFAPAQFSAAPGQQIHLVNTGVLVHDIVIDEWDVDSGALGGGEETTFHIPDDAEVGAEVHFYCSVPGHLESGMEGYITIVEADSRDAGAATPAPEATPVDDASPEAAGTPVAEQADAEEDDGEDGEEAVASGADTGPITITCIDIDYEEKEVTIPADTDVEFEVVNEGVLQHDFNIEGTDFASEMLNSGGEDSLTVNLPAGEYVYFCSVPGHREAGMVGTLIVE